MEIKLSDTEVRKILSTISTEELRDKLEFNWGYWDVENDYESGYGFKLKLLKQKKFDEESKKDYIYIKELNIEIQKDIHHKNKSYDELVKEFGKEFLEEHLPTYQELQILRNLEFQKKYKLNLIDTYEYILQEDLISKKNGYVAVFCANSSGLYLGAVGCSNVAGSNRGVRFIKRNIKKK